MKSNNERRSPSTIRVSHTALVELCSLEREEALFQGQSANISGRGMQVRGSYLPEIGEGLVCRFEHDRQEVLVEGRVAWRSEGEESGEFGIQFTALDADSAELLRSMGETSASATPSPTIDQEEDDDESSEVEWAPGQRLRMHIEGLGAPMKASVVSENRRKIRVASALEFLKQGRSVGLQAMGETGTVGAHVDSVNVVLNPATNIPELVVQLRYEGVSPTPPPARVEGGGSSAFLDTDSVRSELDDEGFTELDQSEELSDEEGGSWQPAAEVMMTRLGGAVRSAGAATAQASRSLSSMAQKAATSVMAKMPERARPPEGEVRRQQSRGKAVKRKTGPAARSSKRAPSHLRSGIHDLKLGRGAERRPGRKSLSGTSRSVPPAPAPRRRRVSPAAVAGLITIALVTSAWMLRDWGGDEPQEAPATVASKESPKTSSSAQPSPVPPKSKPDPATEGEIVAEVPLFGPQAVASLSKARPAESVDVAEAEKLAAAATVEDQVWEETPDVAAAESAKPWGRGRLYLPTIHRIRLDKAGAALSGVVNADGFTVVIPGVKVMESGKTIQKRDKRIVAVKADNEGPSAKVRFEFRGPVPPYRVRLRQDFVEFLISAPEESVATL